MSSIQTSRARCALYKKILGLLDEESFSGESSGRAIYKFDEKFYRFEKVSRLLKYDSIYFGPQTYLLYLKMKNDVGLIRA